MPELYKQIKKFSGIKNNEDPKNVSTDYFFNIVNLNFPDAGIVGLKKIRMPVRRAQLSFVAIDGLFEYRFLDASNVLQQQIIAVTDGKLFKDVLTTPIVLRDDLSLGKVTFAIFNDKLYIANGKDFVLVYSGQKGVVSQMGAPIITVAPRFGPLTGTYFYALTYITDGGEEIVGSISNSLTLSSNQVNLELPRGYAGTIRRRLYRTEGNSTQLRFLVDILDNTTINLVDDTPDSELCDLFNNVANNELPRPYFLTVFNERLIGGKEDQLPTQVFISDVEIDVFDRANSLDISNFSDDETAVASVNIDFSKVIVGTERHIYLLNLGTPTTVTITRANVGIKSGYTAIRIPTNATFEGGLLFVSTLNDVRLLQGLQALPVASSIDNIKTLDLAQNIRGTLSIRLKAATNLHAEFFNYRYHLAVDDVKYVLDIRNLAWTQHDIKTTNFQSRPIVLRVLLQELFNGQDDGFIEEEYQDEQYRGEEVTATLESPEIEVAPYYTFVQKLVFWLLPRTRNTQEIQVILDDDPRLTDMSTFSFIGGAFDPAFYDSAFYDTGKTTMDYRIFNIYRPVRWIKFILKNITGSIDFQGWGIYIEKLRNKE